MTAVSSPASAEGPCGTTLASRFDGMNSQRLTSTYGARARIEYRNPTLCTGAGSGVTTAWSMVTSYSATQGSGLDYWGWAQSGWGKWGSAWAISGSHNFAQWTRQCKSAGTACGTDGPAKTVITGTPAQQGFYSVYRQASNGLITMVANGETLATMGYDTQGVWQPAWQTQYQGETKNAGDNMPGNSTDKAAFDYLQQYNSSGSLNFFTDAQLNAPQSDLAKYKYGQFSPSVGGVGLRVWTDPA